MRINFNLWSAGVCGGNRTVYNLANGLTERGHEVTATFCLLVEIISGSEQ